MRNEFVCYCSSTFTAERLGNVDRGSALLEVRELYLFIRLLRESTGRMNTVEHSFSCPFHLTNIVDSKVLCEDLSREESRGKTKQGKLKFVKKKLKCELRLLSAE